jgi:hypothetical protein
VQVRVEVKSGLHGQLGQEPVEGGLQCYGHYPGREVPERPLGLAGRQGRLD